jgi:hypothetical protein
MIITRKKHMSYLVGLMPLLFIALAIQCYIYTQWISYDLAIDVSIFMGMGVVLTATGFAIYDHFHKVQLYRRHLSIKFALINYEEEILYRHIQYMDVETTEHAYYNVTLTLVDQSIYKLYYLDDIQELKSLIKAAA